jgi:hypothetical protein
MIKRLQREGGDVGLQWVHAVILDYSDVDEPALLEMEQREQLTENFKVRYADIDYLLALQEAALLREIDWFDRESLESVAGELQTMAEKSKAEVSRDLYAIKYMNEFLKSMDQPGQYHRMLKTLEKFRDIGRMMMYVEVQYPLESDRILQVLFAAVRSGLPHEDIRSIRKMFRKERERFDRLSDSIATAEEGWTSDASTLSSPSVIGGMDDEEDEESEAGPQVANYPGTEVTALIRVAIDGFNSSQQQNALQMLQEVLNRLEVLDDCDRLLAALSSATGDEVRTAIGFIAEWAERARSLA